MKKSIVFLAAFAVGFGAAAAARIELTAWPSAAVRVAAATDGDGQAPENPQEMFDGNAATFATFARLQGAVLELEFDPARPIGELAIRQGGWVNWAVPGKLGVTVNDEPARTWVLNDDAGNCNLGIAGGIQRLPLQTTVRRLRLEVLETLPREDRMPWGTIAADLGEGTVAPLELDFRAAPLSRHVRQLEVVVDSAAAGTFPVKAIVGANIEYDAPPLELQPGRNVCTIDLAQLRDSRSYQIDFTAANLHKVMIGAAGLANPELVEWRAVPPEDAAAAAEWFEFEPIPDHRVTIDGREYREGMSRLSAGRFGNSTYNGLLTETVGDFWFQTYTAGLQAPLRRQKFDIAISGFHAERQEADAGQPWLVAMNQSAIPETIQNSWTHMERQVEVGAGRHFTLLTGILAPGFLVDSDVAFEVSSRGGGDIPLRSGAPNENESRFFADAGSQDGIPRLGPSLVVTPDGIFPEPGELSFATTPWAIAIWGGVDSPGYFGDEAAAVLFTADAGTFQWDRTGVALPSGIVGISSAFGGLLRRNWQVEALRERAGLLAGMLHNYPVRCQEFFRLDGDELEIINRFEYFAWGKPERRAPDFAPVPPIFAWARQTRNWTGVPWRQDRILPTPVGPYTWEDGNELRYRLPVYAPEHAAFPRTPESAEFYEQLSAELLQMECRDEDFLAPGDAWLTSFRTPLFVGSAILAAPGLTAEAREKLFWAARRAVENAFSPAAWYPRRELYSKRPYLASLWVDLTVTPAMFGDINSGIGTSCYMLYAYAKYTGDWALAEQLWPRVMDVLRFGLVVNDWAIPMLSAREGVLFGGIDMDTISQVGLEGAEKTARALGQTADADLIAYVRTKNQATTALRLNFNAYLDPARSAPEFWLNGFSESGPNPEFAHAGDGVGLDHVAMCFTWDGQHPESFRFLNRVLGTDQVAAFQRQIVDGPFRQGPANWITMPFNHSRAASHLGARCHLPDWPRDAIRADAAAYVAHHPGARDRENAGFWSAFYGMDENIFLMDWEPARLGQLTWHPERAELAAELSAAEPFELRLHAPRPLRAVLADGVELPPDAVRAEPDNQYVLQLPALHAELVVRFE